MLACAGASSLGTRIASTGMLRAMQGVLRVDTVDGTNWSPALELLGAGEYIEYRGIGLTLAEYDRGHKQLGALHASIPITWHLPNLTEARAMGDIARGTAVVEELIQASQEIRAIVQQRGLRYELVNDYGKGSTLVATVVDGAVHWSDRPWERRTTTSRGD